MRTTSLLALIFLSTSFVSHQSIAAPASLPISLGRELFRPRDFEQYGMQIDGHHATKTIRRRGSLSKRFLQVRAPQHIEKKRDGAKPKDPAKAVENNPNPPNNNNNPNNPPNNNNKPAQPPNDKAGNNKPADNPTTTTTAAKGNATPTKAPTTSSSTAGADAGGANPSTIYSDQPVPTGTLSTGAIAGLAVVGGIFVIGAVLFAFVRKKKRDERTSAIVAKSAVAFEQQTHDYEKLEEPSSLGTFTVLSTYLPNMDDELEIQPGDKVTVLMAYDDGWVQGVNDSRDGAKGVFPRHCIDIDGKRTMAYEKRSSSIGGFTSVNLS